MRSIRWLAPLAAGALALSACGSSSKTGAAATSPTTQPAATTTTSAAPSGSGSFTASLKMTSLGNTLVDAQGMTLYAFKPDGKLKSNCNTGCDTTWPPLKPSGTVTLGAGLDKEDFVVITRNDGSKQLTDYGAPLYTVSGDTQPGDTKGDGIGGVWYAVGAEGKAAKSGATGSADTSSTEPATTTTTGIPGY
jgi:predicted lipoprotein with Yx(FWY)xxD motif